MAYHIRKIQKGELGKLSKIQEELEELQDAEKQGCKIMALVELSDLYGAIELYLKANYPGMIMDDLAVMSKITQRVFLSGGRK